MAEMIELGLGLRYEVLQEALADAQRPAKGNTVVVHYTGWLNEGSEGNDEVGVKFDSSVDRNEKFSFPIGMGYVIRGWDEGVMEMAVGQKIRLYIPSEFGYGSRGAGALIPANADLIFDVELFEIK